MAVSGRRGKPFEASINKGSAEDYERTCDPCLTEGRHVEAHGYCVVCQDYLCLTCFRAHRISTASRDHELLDNAASLPTNLQTSPQEVCTEKCSKHRREIIKFFCPEHEALGCNDCIILEHRAFKIDYIPDKCVGFASSDECKGALEKLDNLLKNVSNVQTIADTRTKEMDEAHKKVEEDVEKFQKDIHSRIAELRTQVIGIADKTRQTKMDEINKVFKTCKKVARDVKQTQLDANNSLSANKNGQLFIAVKRAEQLLKLEDIKEAETAVRQIVSSYTFQPNRNIESLLHDQAVLGRLKSGRKPDAVYYTVKDAVIPRSVTGEKLISAAIEIGFDKTGYSFSLFDQFYEHPIDVSSPNWRRDGTFSVKVPTVILLNPDRSFRAFGHEAITEYRYLSDEDRQEYYLFRSFMLPLYQNTDEKKSYIDDVTGKKLPAIQVLSLLIQFIKQHFFEILNRRCCDVTDLEVRWTITVPERFEKAEHIAEEAAKQAGIDPNHLMIVFESEAAFSYLQKLSMERFEGNWNCSVADFPVGTKYLVVDAGDRMITTTVYEKRDGKTLQLLHAVLDSCGGRCVNDEYEKFISQLFGKDTLQELKKNYVEDFEDLMNEFEVKKMCCSQKSESNKVTIRIPVVIKQIYEESTGKRFIQDNQQFKGLVHCAGEKLRIDYTIFTNMFSQFMNTIVSHIRFVLDDESASGCNVIVMVGGFSASNILQESITETFPRVNVMIPLQPEMAVLTGAVILGHSVSSLEMI